MAPYASIKAALELLGRVAAYERGITVNAVLPGATDTELFRANNPEESRKSLTALTALGRIGQPAVTAGCSGQAGERGAAVVGDHVR